MNFLANFIIWLHKVQNIAHKSCWLLLWCFCSIFLNYFGTWHLLLYGKNILQKSIGELSITITEQHGLGCLQIALKYDAQIHLYVLYVLLVFVCWCMLTLDSGLWRHSYSLASPPDTSRLIELRKSSLGFSSFAIFAERPHKLLSFMQRVHHTVCSKLRMHRRFREKNNDDLWCKLNHETHKSSL